MEMGLLFRGVAQRSRFYLQEQTPSPGQSLQMVSWFHYTIGWYTPVEKVPYNPWTTLVGQEVDGPPYKKRELGMISTVLSLL